MKVFYSPIPDFETYWCNTHRRRASKFCWKISDSTAVSVSVEACCEGPGIMLPCECVRLTGIAEIAEIEETT